MVITSVCLYWFRLVPVSLQCQKGQTGSGITRQFPTRSSSVCAGSQILCADAVVSLHSLIIWLTHLPQILCADAVVSLHSHNLINPFTPQDWRGNAQCPDAKSLPIHANSGLLHTTEGKILFFGQRNFLFSQIPKLPTAKTDQHDQLCIMNMRWWA